MSKKRENLLKRFFADVSGGTGIEYGLIAGAMAITIVGAVQIAGVETQKPFNGVAAGLQSATP